MIRILLRLPSPRFEADLTTGIASIDDYLKQVDAGLVGAKSVRRLTLLEARDFLLEASESTQAESQEQALLEAMQAFGAPADIARKQRSERYRFFLRSALLAGLFYASFMLFLSLISATETRWIHAAVFAFQALWFGMIIGLLEAFCFSPQSLPSKQEGPDEQSSFLVSYSRSSIFAAWLLVIGLGFFAVMILLGLAGIGGFSEETVLLNIVLLAFIFLFIAKAFASLLFKIQVSNRTISIHSLGTQARLSLEQVTGFHRAPHWHFWLTSAFWAPFWLEWRDERGCTRSMIVGLNGQLTNADRFQALMELVIESRPDQVDSELAEQTRQEDQSA